MKIAVITAHEGDFLQRLRETDAEVKVIKPNQLDEANLNFYDSIAVLGGGGEVPLLLEPKDRKALEKQINKGKKIFAEYVASIGNVYFSPPESTRYKRLVFSSDEMQIADLKRGTLIDDQCSMHLRPHAFTCRNNIPILQYVKKHAHGQIQVTDELLEEISDRALWFDDPANLLICSFRLSSFKQARFTPWKDSKKVVEFIIGWLLEEEISLHNFQPSYTTGEAHQPTTLEELVNKVAKQALNWFKNADIILQNGKRGAYEGIGTEIYPDGSQRKSEIYRADCIGEISLPFFLDYLLHGNEESLEISNNLTDYLFKNYLNDEPGNLYGMMRWTNEAWGVCYQDDVARAIIPHLLKCYYLKTEDHLNACVDALAFLVKTTGTDGTRVFRTINTELTEDKLRQLKETPGNLPSAHYNAYYHAALLLAYKLTGEETFKETAVKGLSTIMEVYPDTQREQSETQEYCRLILPLSWLYWVTGNNEHKEWLYRVTEDLEQFKHPYGGYLEQDFGYKASMRNEVGEGENSLITKNGDPVVDLLYSNNWLSIGFIQAYFITGDKKYMKLWQDISSFFAKTQIHSDNTQINGAWARAYDVERTEVFGSPADVGWGPWAIESGWTVAEITAGLYMGLLEKQLGLHYKD